MTETLWLDSIVKPGLDKLVPSRCALQVGEIDVLVISEGVLPPRQPKGLVDDTEGAYQTLSFRAR